MQILFASLLTVVFTDRFATISSLQRGTYVVTLLAAACATALHKQKDDLVRVSHRLALGGLGRLMVAVVGVVLLILEEVLGPGPAPWCSAGVGVVFVLVWLVVPLASHTRDEQPGPD